MPRISATDCLPELRTLAAAGNTNDEIAAALGVSNRSVRRWRREHGIKLQPSATYLGRIAAVRELYSAGVTITECAKRFDISHETARQYLGDLKYERDRSPVPLRNEVIRAAHRGGMRLNQLALWFQMSHVAIWKICNPERVAEHKQDSKIQQDFWRNQLREVRETGKCFGPKKEHMKSQGWIEYFYSSRRWELTKRGENELARG